MSRNAENFEQLLRLLKLKRYEQPAPRYFNHFSSQIIARIKLGERGDSDAAPGWMLWEAAWLQRIWAAFEVKPVLAGAFGLAICATLTTGVLYSGRTGVQALAVVPDTDSSGFSSQEVAAAMAANHPLLVKPVAFEPSSTDPITAGPFTDHR